MKELKCSPSSPSVPSSGAVVTSRPTVTMRQSIPTAPTAITGMRP